MDNVYTAMGGLIDGVNYEQLGYELKSIVDNYNSLMHTLAAGVVSFFETLRKEWASQNAFDFSEQFIDVINAYSKNIREMYDRIINDIIWAGQRTASALGTSFNPVYEGLLIHEFSIEGIGLYSKNEAGQTGMNIRLVEDLLITKLPQIRDDVNLVALSLPSSISLYDAGGEQAQIFSTRKQSIVNMLDEVLTSLQDNIRTNIETEKNNILLAKQQVVQNMSGSSTTNA